MKKPTISIEELRAVVATLGERMRLAERMAAWLAKNPTFTDAEIALATTFDVTDPVPAAPDGRGERFSAHVFIAWHEDLGPVDVVMAELTQMLVGVAGIEEVSQATVDTQLGAFWGVDVVFRSTQ